jgi:hypothetical protein
MAAISHVLEYHHEMMIRCAMAEKWVDYNDHAEAWMQGYFDLTGEHFQP